MYCDADCCLGGNWTECNAMVTKVEKREERGLEWMFIGSELTDFKHTDTHMRGISTVNSGVNNLR